MFKPYFQILDQNLEVCYFALLINRLLKFPDHSLGINMKKLVFQTI